MCIITVVRTLAINELQDIPKFASAKHKLLKTFEKTNRDIIKIF
ncbi:MFS type sugar transporter [Rickettsia prowazekii str. Rp22]|uniref:MFS type sugar transporter n=1 Tax=Rickettsia prowazekii (strain Rp22) TaxID=449216 RepID=D5AYC4_RICPP|nr:MFS type sugar transporter [Rickettsia prowazekii str. Rp22]AGJ01492.1 hypothetical protein H374_2040 [Rickettsia prowazekii str. NMRC Madrid E]AGJ02906.1 MFS type sugar transporter [Rickettsia prowazekii str. Breinl]EOB09411.1 MFS type sugar transporter [Rickettsia prowazekii str. Cairo 3]EOB10231.1 MFS type sugar transporter [Rickettsia prowazekii str. GvF12]